MKFITLKIELIGSNIRRTIAVPAGLSLTGLSEAIQCVMDWNGAHLWEFSDGDSVRYGEDRGDGDNWGGGAPCISADGISVVHAFPKRGAHLLYTYDFGDDWRHKVTRMADPKVEEIACLKTRGTYGIDDIGGEWGLLCHIRQLEKELRNDGKGAPKGDLGYYWGHDTPEAKRKFLEGPSIEELTDRLRDRLANESLLPVDETKGADVSVDEQAKTLGAVFNLTLDAYTWNILDQAMAEGGKVIYEDQDGDIKNFLVERFSGLKFKRANSARWLWSYEITVPPEWVEMHRVHGKMWREAHAILDVFEAHACSAAFLYGVVSLDDLTEIIKHYDPDWLLPDMESLENLLDQRSRCPSMPFRMVDRHVVANCIIPAEGNDRGQIREFQTVMQKMAFARWHPKNREELFQWELGPCYERAEECAEGPEAKFLDLFEDKFGKDSFYGCDSALDCVQEAFYQGGNATEAIKLLKEHEIADIRAASRSVKAEAEKLIREIGLRVRVPLLKGHTRAEVGLTSDEKLSVFMANTMKNAPSSDSNDEQIGGFYNPMFDFEPMEPACREEPKIGRNDPCPCGSGKKYKKCCGK